LTEALDKKDLIIEQLQQNSAHPESVSGIDWYFNVLFVFYLFHFCVVYLLSVLEGVALLL